MARVGVNVVVTDRASAERNIEDHPLFSEPVVVPDDLGTRARQREWPAGLLERALALRVPLHDIAFWLDDARSTADGVSSMLDTNERVFDGALRVREATWRDSEALTDLYAHAPENVRGWRLVVERGPNPHAQFRLQEQATLQVVEHLDDPSWGPKPGFWAQVFGWDDYRVIEDGGEIVACGGLWDRGRDVREVWSTEAGERRTVEPTALLDWGHVGGRADAMASLIRVFLGRTAELGRTNLIAPLEHAPDVLAHLADLDPATETRALRCMGFNDDTVRVEPNVTRYADLAYW